MRNWKRRLQRAATEMLALPRDAVLDVSRLTCIDGTEIVVENAVSLLHVREDQVDIDLGNYKLVLAGQKFVVALVSGREIHVRGQISEIIYQPRREGRP